MEWYYEARGEQRGPVTDDELLELVARGIITDGTLIWCEGMEEWQTYGQVKARPAQAAQAEGAPVPMVGQAVCCECGRTFSTDDLIKHGDLHVCAECKPIFVQRLKEGVRLPTEMEYGGFWIRFAAKLIDIVILSIFNQVVQLILGLFMGTVGQMPTEFTPAIFLMIGIQFAIGLSVQIAYYTWFVGKYAATPGKMACQLKIVTAEGERVSYGRACGRFFAEFLTGFTLGIGYLIAAFDDQKRTLHDHIVNTRVVKK